MGGCCTNSTTLRLISNNGFHISEHGLAILFDIWNKLYYTRHIKYNWMDHLTGICFKNSHSSAFAWLSWYAGNTSCVSLASVSLICLWKSHAHFPPSDGPLVTTTMRPHSCISFQRRSGCQVAAEGRSSVTILARSQAIDCTISHSLTLSVWLWLPAGTSACFVTMSHREIGFVEFPVTWIERRKNRKGPSVLHPLIKEPHGGRERRSWK